MRAIIKTENLSFAYPGNKRKALDSVNIEIQRGSITALAGLSGCGKTTLAYCLCGIIPKGIAGKIEGKVFIEDQDIERLSLAELSKKIGMVFQDVDNQLFLPTTEAEIAFAPENFCYTYDEIDEIVKKTLGKLKIEKLRFKNPSKLSGGEKHLAALASIISLDPDIIILDEILSELDSSNRQLIIDNIFNFKEMGKTIVIIDHSIENLKLAEKIYLMDKGKIIEEIEVGKDYGTIQDKLTDFFLRQRKSFE